MTGRASLLAGAAESLSALCIFNILCATMLLASRGWDLAAGWLLLPGLVWSALYAVLLRSPRTTGLLAAVTGGAVALTLALWLLVTDMALGVFVVLVLLTGAGMAVGLPLYHTLRAPSVHAHLSHLDVLILATLWLLLMESGGAEKSPGTAAWAVMLLLADAATAVTLRTDGGRGALRAALPALGSAALLALVISALVRLFSRSGAVTGAVFGGIASFFRRLWTAIDRWMTTLASHIHHEEVFEALDPGEELPSLAGVEAGGTTLSLQHPWIPAVVLGLLALGVVLFFVLRFRRHRLSSVSVGAVGGAQEVRVSRLKGALRRRLEELLRALRFRLTARRHRDTPAGVLVWLEHHGRRRRPGETVREYLIDRDPVLFAPLADALDAEFFGGGAPSLTPAECRQLRADTRRRIHHG